MSKITAKFMTPSSSQGRNIRLCVHEEVQNRKGLPVSMYETVNSRNLPPNRCQMFLESTPSPNSKSWFTISSPLRKVDANGFYILKPRTDEAGAFLNHRGEHVSNAQEAAKIYDYVKDNQGKVVWGVTSTLNVKNETKDGEKTKGTMLSAKFFTDQEALYVNQEMKRIKELPQEDKKAQYDKLGKEKSAMGQWTNMFINDGHDILRNFGFEVREMPGRDQSIQNEPPVPGGFGDDIPF